MSGTRTIYFKGDGKAYDLASIDANRALREHSSEWSDKEWPKDEVEKYAKEYAAKLAKAEADAKAAQNKS